VIFVEIQSGTSSLGVVSVYSLAIIGRTISWKIAAAAYATVAIFGTPSGLISRLLL
jgi:ABC-type dipeptide/oligopeptide/nickel transport system permease subunit